jgi:hypothetical protein
MAITIEDLGRTIEKVPGFKPRPGPFPGTTGLVFRTQHYEDSDGDKTLLVVIALEENGEYIKIFAPMAMKAKGRHTDDLLKACAMVQYKTKLIQFEYDEDDGEIRPMVEWPIEDGTITAKQIARAVHGLVTLVDRFYPVLAQAAAKGKINFDLLAPEKQTGLDPHVRELLEALAAQQKDDKDKGSGQGHVV